jgi:ABC-type transport system involved in Fe-S cluster assembly fused permease/ATPase subunit
MGALNSLAQGRTSLIVTHRTSSIVDADEILVLKEGTIGSLAMCIVCSYFAPLY